MSSNNSNKKKGGKPPTSLSTSNTNIPTTRSRSSSNSSNGGEVVMAGTPSTQSILSSSPVSAPIPIPTAKKVSVKSSPQPIVNNSKKVVNATPSSSIGSNSSSVASSPSSVGGSFNKPFSAPSTFGGMLSRMQQQQQHLFKNSNNTKVNSNIDSIKSSNSGFLRPVGIPISSSFNQKNQVNQSSANSSPKISSSSSRIGSSSNLQLSTSSDSSMSTSPNFSSSFTKQSPNSYYSGFQGLSNNSFSSASPSPTTTHHNLFRRGSPPSIYLKPSPPGSFHVPSSNNSFLMPSPQSASEVFGSKSSTSSSSATKPSNSGAIKNQPKTKTIGFEIPSSASTATNKDIKKETTTTTTATPTTPTTPRKKKSFSKEAIIPAYELEFDSQESDQSDNEDDFDLKEDSNEEEEEGEITSPPQKEITAKDNKCFVNIENLDTVSIEKMVMEGWKKQIPRFHQKDAVVKILQNIVEQFKIDSKKIAPLLSPATPLGTPLSPLGILSAPSSTNSDTSIISNYTTNTTTSGLGINQVIKPIKNVKNYLVQHAAGSGKSLTIACLVYNLYRLLEEGRLKYDLILILNDKRHLDTQLGSIITQFLKDNDLKSVIHPSTVRLLKEILSKAKTRVVITTMQKFSSIIDQFDQISSKYKSIALISDETQRSHGKATKNLNSILTNENRQNNNITYFCFTCTPTPKCLEMFGDTRGNLRVPFHTYSLEKALQDKIIMDVTMNYTTVAILTKVSNNDKVNGSGLYDEKKASYHLLKDTQNDKKIIQEKSSYIIKHFVKLKEQMNNKDFTGRAMLVTSSREQMLLYKQTLEALVKALPKGEKFDIIASFSPFEQKKKLKDESDPKINGVYANYCSKRNGISEILRHDTKCKVQLIIVADKLQTGFNEPSLAVMYIDKALKSADAVQTFGRLSRVAKGKSQCYIVDFINTRREIQDAFNQYWRETCLKGATRKTVLEMKLNRILNKLSSIEPLSQGKLQESVDYILQDDERKKREKARVHSITEDITHFVDLCNQLLWDNQPPMNVRFLEAVKFSVCQKRVSTQIHSIRGFLQNIENKSALGGLNQQNSNFSLTSNKSIFGKKSNEKIISLKQEEYRYLDSFRTHQEDSMDLDAEDLEFAREIWSANPEIKLHSRLLGNEEEREEEIDSIGFNLKMFEQAETLEQVIEIVVEFVSRNGPTFEGFIKNQSMSTIFPFIDPSNENYHLYKQKLDKARTKYNQEQQKLIHQQLQHQREQHQQQQLLKEHLVTESSDIVMSEVASNNSSGQIQFNLKTPWNNQDIPFPVPLPIVLQEEVVGKPHAEGRMEDCLLDDCVLSFCNDLDTKEPKDAPIRVYAIQVLGMLANKGVHKNQLFEIVGCIHKILLNRQENISIKMIALDLLALVATQDEVTISQIVDFGLINTIIKLIQTADDPLKAKCCKFFTILHNDVSIVSTLIENQGICAITTLLESYDYIVTEQALRCLISLAQEDRTIKTIRTSIDPNVLARLEHHKIQVIHDLTNQLKTLISGSKRSLQQFQPLISNTKRIRSNSTLSTMSTSKLNSKKLLSKSSSNNNISISDGDKKNSLSTSQPNISLQNNDEQEIITTRRISTSDNGGDTNSDIINDIKDSDDSKDKDKDIEINNKDNNKNNKDNNQNNNQNNQKIGKTITKPITRSVLKL
ncbi:hypothetical protein DICPUDRAFT_99404 [Dictyostelium purpureum]|uniref:Helicase ATP-binding domain-containing protein n=1 Tax=Dictyostelium purpureum TaxID=5786 RepID=F0ZYY5_DICPU|nr:uncharacterized protein DICPUDRAFT_99404 [Dictyostelium purpureum]EGC30838.1 hypothetical protein DICPUDRAFT_99404 [Dictyostelium purpureum]|eukprot:XP_003292627.1 hypothetical protein DICPUDRAFT_99404 [Dictyostelium purpureum]